MEIFNLDIEVDSLCTKQLLTSGKGNWKVAQTLDFITKVIKFTHSSYSHIYREVNGAADFLANYAVNAKADFSMAPPFILLKLRAILLLDNTCPFVRI